MVVASPLLLTLGLYRFRRHVVARLLRLPPPHCGVKVDRNIPVAMPDGIHLLTDHYAPEAEGEFPTILIRTPYGRGKELDLWGGYALAELPAQRFAERGYHVIVQGVRGCFDSEGVFEPHVNEASDGQAAVEWIAQQPWFNGKLGTWGPSYLGYTQWATAAGNHPSLQAMVPMITSAENLSVTHPDGAFGLETRLRWSQGIFALNRTHRQPLWRQLLHRFSDKQAQALQAAFYHLPLLEADTIATGEPIPFYRAVLTHTRQDDPFWAARDHSPAVAQVSAPVHLIGGWYDYYLRGLLRDYTSLRDAGQRPFLTIGPWSHAQAGGLMTGLREGLTWFDAHLKGWPTGVREKPVRLYVMGIDEWREYDYYPPPSRPTPYYLHSVGELSTVAPEDVSPPDRYVYDPRDPTPSLGGALLAFSGAGMQENGPLEVRPDVLVYTTSAVDQEVEIIGPVRAELYVQSSLEHTDFFARLCDVDVSGKSTNICDGLVRLSPAEGWLPQDGIRRVEIDMWSTAHRFRRGHCIRLQVSSGAHPRYSRNTGSGEPIESATTLRVASQAVYHDPAHPSAVLLPVTS
jgi:putative CocE/NonD family hydrolase